MGRFIRPRPPLTKVIVVSYSAFDTFVIPDAEEAERVGYIYCGLRHRIRDEDELNTARPEYALKTPMEIERDFLGSVQRIFEQERKAVLTEVLRPVLKDSSFTRIGLAPLLDTYDEEDLAEFFNQLSSGHKIVIKILAELVCHLDGDEPETHLHPPLVATCGFYGL